MIEHSGVQNISNLTLLFQKSILLERTQSFEHMTCFSRTRVLICGLDMHGIVCVGVCAG